MHKSSDQTTEKECWIFPINNLDRLSQGDTQQGTSKITFLQMYTPANADQKLLHIRRKSNRYIPKEICQKSDQT